MHRIVVIGLGMAVKPHAAARRDGGGGGADPMAFDHAPNTRLLADFLDAFEQDRAP
jgi:hypothetical protein